MSISREDFDQIIQDWIELAGEGFVEYAIQTHLIDRTERKYSDPALSLDKLIEVLWKLEKGNMSSMDIAFDLIKQINNRWRTFKTL